MTEPARGVLSRLGYWLWGLAADLAIFFITVWWGGLCIVTILLTRRGWAADVYGRIWCRWILKVCGIHVDVEGVEHVDPSRSYVIVSNHLSNFDIWATLAAVPLNIRFVAKKELLRLPIFGQALALSNHIVIDRSNPEAAIARINQRIASQIDSGFCILFYAEGTRSRDGKVHAFKKGGVTLGLRTGLPIVPMTVSGTRKFLPRSHVIIRPGGRVKIVLGRPIATKDWPLERRDELNEQVRDVIITNYVEDY
jgi:1-acyl-sn-glycerol-3-phosphate acyltransferase